MSSSIPQDALNQVLDNQMCIGCGACAALRNSKLTIQFDAHGRLSATKVCNSLTTLESLVCPFSNRVPDESDLGRSLFSKLNSEDKYLGHFLSLHVGFVSESDYRVKGSSGGVGKWILRELIEKKRVDAVIHVVENQNSSEDRVLYQYAVTSDPSQVIQGSKSVYYPVEMSGVLRHVRENPRRYAITGVPCFIKAIRLLAGQEPIFRERIKFCVGMFCGHLKSTAYAEMLAWQMGVTPADLLSIDFRGKLPRKPANFKGVFAKSSKDPDQDIGPAITRELFGGAYNYGFFQYKACDYCDDVVAETADVSIGDAWLPEFIKDARGTSIVIVRDKEIEELVKAGIEERRLSLRTISARKVIKSQWGGFQHRREGLSYRLKLADQNGEWRPRKRIKPGSRWLTKRRKEIYRLRMRMRERSHEVFTTAKEIGDLEFFKKEMQPLLTKYEAHYAPTLFHRVRRGLQRRLSLLISARFPQGRN